MALAARPGTRADLPAPATRAVRYDQWNDFAIVVKWATQETKTAS